MEIQKFYAILQATLIARAHILDADPHHETAIRLMNGFLEGYPELVVDLYADTLVLHNHAKSSDTGYLLNHEAQAFYLRQLPWVKTVVLKTHSTINQQIFKKRGVITFGRTPARKIREHGIWYALDLLLHQDATFYPDTRYLRRWLMDHLSRNRVLNTFAYTGSLGVAALAGGASQVVHLDLDRTFLKIAKNSYSLNNFPVKSNDFIEGDFFPTINALKRKRTLFDCVILDPPFFSITSRGRVDLVTRNARLINKVRPLISDRGWLVSVNNALFVSGKVYMEMLIGLCADGYLSVEEIIPIPDDCAGYPTTRVLSLPVDPAPFNHATKIAILRVRRK